MRWSVGAVACSAMPCIPLFKDCECGHPTMVMCRQLRDAPNAPVGLATLQIRMYRNKRTLKKHKIRIPDGQTDEQIPFNLFTSALCWHDKDTVSLTRPASAF